MPTIISNQGLDKLKEISLQKGKDAVYETELIQDRETPGSDEQR